MQPGRPVGHNHPGDLAALKMRRLHEATSRDLGEKFYESNCAHRAEIPRGTQIENDDNGEPICKHCRIQKEKAMAKVGKRDFAGGVLNPAEMVARDEADKADQAALEELRAKKKEAAAANKAAKLLQAAEKDKKVAEALAVLRPLLEKTEQLGGDGADYDEATATTHGELKEAMVGLRVGMDPVINQAREELNRLEAFRKEKKGVAAAAVNKHEAAVMANTDKIMDMLQSVHNGSSYDAAEWRVKVTALVEAMGAKF